MEDSSEMIRDPQGNRQSRENQSNLGNEKVRLACPNLNGMCYARAQFEQPLIQHPQSIHVGLAWSMACKEGVCTY